LAMQSRRQRSEQRKPARNRDVLSGDRRQKAGARTNYDRDSHDRKRDEQNEVRSEPLFYFSILT
jgi:hypothetical protein